METDMRANPVIFKSQILSFFFAISNLRPPLNNQYLQYMQCFKRNHNYKQGLYNSRISMIQSRFIQIPQWYELVDEAFSGWGTLCSMCRTFYVPNSLFHYCGWYKLVSSDHTPERWALPTYCGCSTRHLNRTYIQVLSDGCAAARKPHQSQIDLCRCISHAFVFRLC